MGAHRSFAPRSRVNRPSARRLCTAQRPSLSTRAPSLHAPQQPLATDRGTRRTSGSDARSFASVRSLARSSAAQQRALTSPSRVGDDALLCCSRFDSGRRRRNGARRANALTQEAAAGRLHQCMLILQAHRACSHPARPHELLDDQCAREVTSNDAAARRAHRYKVRQRLRT